MATSRKAHSCYSIALKQRCVAMPACCCSFVIVWELIVWEAKAAVSMVAISVAEPLKN